LAKKFDGKKIGNRYGFKQCHSEGVWFPKENSDRRISPLASDSLSKACITNTNGLYSCQSSSGWKPKPRPFSHFWALHIEEVLVRIPILRLILITDPPQMLGNLNMLELSNSTTESAVPTFPTAKKQPPVPLRSLPAGQLATITSLHGSAHDVARLAEMGLRPGTDVVVIRNGITCIVQLDGSRLCIRLSSDLQILVSVFELT
jgi:Fe2+ transport system protein FeoA